MSRGGEPGDDAKLFESLGDKWWDPSGPLSSLHKITPLRFEYFRSRAEEAIGGIAGKSLLDVGCGGGLLSEEFCKADARVSGIDLSATAIEAARAHAAKGGLDIDYRVASVGSVLEEKGPGAFDCVLCSEVLEHVEDLGAFIAEASALIKSGGLFFFSTINKTLKARFFAVFVAEDILGMLPQGTHDPKRFIRPSTLVSLLGENSVETEEIMGMSFDVLGFSFKITRDTSVNYIGYGVRS